MKRILPVEELARDERFVRIKIEAISLDSTSIAPLLMDRFWPIAEVHDRPLIQCTTGSSATSAEEVKREAN